MRLQRLLVLILIFPSYIFGQDVQFEWVNVVGSPSHDYTLSVATDANGNVYSMGAFQGTVDMDPGPAVLNLTSKSGADLFITKYDANGNLIWTRQIGSPNGNMTVARHMTVDPAGNVYVTGDFSATVDFDPGPAIANLTCTGTGYAAFL